MACSASKPFASPNCFCPFLNTTLSLSVRNHRPKQSRRSWGNRWHKTLCCWSFWHAPITAWKFKAELPSSPCLPGFQWMWRMLRYKMILKPSKISWNSRFQAFLVAKKIGGRPSANPSKSSKPKKGIFSTKMAMSCPLSKKKSIQLWWCLKSCWNMMNDLQKDKKVGNDPFKNPGNSRTFHEGHWKACALGWRLLMSATLVQTILHFPKAQFSLVIFRRWGVDRRVSDNTPLQPCFVQCSQVCYGSWPLLSC